MSEEVRIIITDETSSEGAPVSTPRSSAPSTPMAPKNEKDAKKASQKAVAAGLVAYREISPYVSQVAQFQVSQIEITTGSAEAQRKAQALSNVAGTGLSIVVAGLAGFASVGTVAAGAAAAGTAAVMAAFQGMISMSYKASEIQNQRRLENENLALRKSRLGLATNRSRTGGVS